MGQDNGIANGTPSPERPNPASMLVGLTLDGGWKVVERAQTRPGATGANFSVGYIVEASSGQRAYLKALDFFSRIAESRDPARELQPLLEAFNFERDLLTQCRDRKLSRVVMAMADGKVTVPGVAGIATVQYIIFELAEGDVRVQMDAAERFDAAWALRALHQIATGLRQLHGIGAAHQDLKPSNVLLFNGRTSSKVADLGRAAVRGQRPPHEDDVVAGDPAYAPPEVLYGEPPTDWAARRMGCDAYHLGSMIVFFFTTGSMTPLLLSYLDRSHWPHQWVGSYQEVLPYLYSAFEKALYDVEQLIPNAERGELMEIVRQLCDPDPGLRGHPKNRQILGNRYSLERYVAWLNLLATRAEHRMTRGQRGSGVVTV